MLHLRIQIPPPPQTYWLSLSHHPDLPCFTAVSFFRALRSFCPICLFNGLILKFKIQYCSCERYPSDWHSTSRQKIMLLHFGEVQTISWYYLTLVLYMCKFFDFKWVTSVSHQCETCEIRLSTQRPLFILQSCQESYQFLKMCGSCKNGCWALHTETF